MNTFFKNEGVSRSISYNLIITHISFYLNVLVRHGR